jgi:hypothetical protein
MVFGITMLTCAQNDFKTEVLPVSLVLLALLVLASITSIAIIASIASIASANLAS